MPNFEKALVVVALLSSGCSNGDTGSPAVVDSAVPDGIADGADSFVPGEGGDVSADGGGGFAITTVASITLPGAPYGAAFNAGTGKAYFGCASSGDAGVLVNQGIAVIDATHKIVSNITTKNLVTAMVANRTSKKVYASEGNVIDVIDSTTDTIATTFKLPPVDAGLLQAESLAVDSNHDRLYVLASIFGSTSGLVFVVEGPTNTVSATYSVPVRPTEAMILRGSRNIAVDRTSQKVFVLGGDASFDAVTVTLDGTTGTLGTPTTTTFGVGAGESMISVGKNNAAVTLRDKTGTKSILRFLDPSDEDLGGNVTGADGADTDGDGEDDGIMSAKYDPSSGDSALVTAGGLYTTSTFPLTEVERPLSLPKGLISGSVLAVDLDLPAGSFGALYLTTNPDPTTPSPIPSPLVLFLTLQKL